MFLSRDPELQRDVILKVPRLDRLVDEQQVERFFQEAKTIAQLDHPGIVRVFDVGRAATGECYFVMEFVDGMTLSELLQQESLPPVRCAELMAEVAEAMHEAHKRGFVHGDLKPSNILIDKEGHARVADFGLSVHVDTQWRHKGQVSGTPSFMSPEQVRGESHRFDGRTDLWSIGVLMYVVLTGKFPFSGVDADMFDSILHSHPRPLRQIDDSIPRPLENICLRCLSKRMTDRYPTALDLAENLRGWISDAKDNDRMLADTAPLTGPFDAGTENESLVSSPPAAQVIPRGLRSFDDRDADFFLRLIPGPCDRNGLPERIQAWKTRIESTDPDRAFSVGLIYGPSGCGKSSFVKAGLLPQLNDSVTPLYIECSRDDTERRILGAIHKVNRLIADDSLVDAMAALRRAGKGCSGGKVLLVLDQFEQWLHGAGTAIDQSNLVATLRQADGISVQVLILIRDDFWMGITRLFRALDIPIVEGANADHADVFDRRHARRVLALFGQSYGAIPAGPEPLSQGAEAFLDRAIDELAEDEMVSPIRLAVFAEMVKEKSWTEATLANIGGTEGVGVAFLDQSFRHSSANPNHRAHGRAAQSVLQTLLPEPGSDIKGGLRSHRELLAASGYQDQPRRFTDLIRILDKELRLITPVDPESMDEAGPAEASDAGDSTPAAGHYQLTHDYLIPALRQWLTREQQQTWRGRAQLRLREHAALWKPTEDYRFLPGPLGYLAGVLALRPSRRTPTEQRMMQAANRRYRSFAAIAAVVLMLLVWGTWELNGRIRADGLTRAIGNASVEQVPALTDQLASYRRWSIPLLNRLFQAGDDAARRNAAIAMLREDDGYYDYGIERLLQGDLNELPVLRDALFKASPKVIKDLWQEVDNPASAPQRRFYALLSLASLDPNADRWNESLPRLVVDRMFGENVDLQTQIRAALQPIRQHLVPPVLTAVKNSGERTQGILAANALADFARDRPEVLVDAVLGSQASQFPVLFDALLAYRSVAVKLFVAAANEQWTADQPETTKDTIANRRAIASAALLKLGDDAAAWQALRGNEDPRAHSYWLKSVVQVGVDPERLAARLFATDEPETRFVLLQALGEYGDAIRSGEPTTAPQSHLLSEALRDRLVEYAAATYRNQPRSDLHAASAWLLRRLGRADLIANINDEIATKLFSPQQGWFVNRHGLTMIKIPAGKFDAGSDPFDPLANYNERRTHVSITRPFAISDREISIQLFQQFYRDVIGFQYGDRSQVVSPHDEDGPAVGMTWYEAIAFCRWLSDKEGIDPRRNCLPSVPSLMPKLLQAGLGEPTELKLPADFLDRPGYRLPTEAEWEYACRAGSNTKYHFGNDKSLVGRYAWNRDNASPADGSLRTWPGGLLRPNRWGLFDTHGNVAEWCLDGYRAMRIDASDPIGTGIGLNGVVRGGGWFARDHGCRSAARMPMQTAVRIPWNGFRVVLAGFDSIEKSASTQ